MDPFTFLILGAIGYSIFRESDQERQRREQAEGEERAREAAKKAELARARQAEEAKKRELAWLNRPFASTRECFSAQYVSFTRMRAYLSCPYRFKLVYLDRRKPAYDADLFGRGRLIHQAIESYLRGFTGKRIEALDLEEKQLLRQAVTPLVVRATLERLSAEQNIRQTRIREVAKHFCESFPRPVTILGVEHELSFQLNGVKVYGIADAILKHDSGQFEIIDFKTGRQTPEREQLELYCLPLAEQTGSLPIKLRFMRLDREYHHSWLVDRKNIEQIRVKMWSLISTMLGDTSFRPNAGSHCARCGVRDYCSPMGRASASPATPLPVFTRVKYRKPNVSRFEFVEGASSGDTPSRRPSTGKSFRYVRAKREYRCQETGQLIRLDEFHFSDHKGGRLSVQGYLKRWPARAQAVNEIIKMNADVHEGQPPC